MGRFVAIRWILTLIFVPLLISTSAWALGANGRFRVGGNLGVVVGGSGNLRFTCSAPYGSKVCGGASTAWEYTAAKIESNPAIELFGMIRTVGNLYLGLAASAVTGNTFRVKSTGAIFDIGSEIGIAPTLEWTPELTDDLSAIARVRFGLAAVLVGGDMDDIDRHNQSICADLRAQSYQCYAEADTKWQMQGAASIGLRYKVGNIHWRGELSLQGVDFRDLATFETTSGSKKIDWQDGVTGITRSMLTLGADL